MAEEDRRYILGGGLWSAYLLSLGFCVCHSRTDAGAYHGKLYLYTVMPAM